MRSVECPLTEGDLQQLDQIKKELDWFDSLPVGWRELNRKYPPGRVAEVVRDFLRQGHKEVHFEEVDCILRARYPGA